MTKLLPKLAGCGLALAIVFASGTAPAAAAELIRRDLAAGPARRASAPLLAAPGVLAREAVHVDAAVLDAAPDTLWLELAPGEPRLAFLVDFERRPDGGLVWRGRFAEDDPGYRSITLSVHQGLVRGSFEAGRLAYSLQPTADGAGELSTLDAGRELRCGVEAAIDEAASAAAPAAPAAPAGAGRAASPPRRAAAAGADRTVTLLVLYSPALGQRWGGRRFAVSYAHHAVDSLNTAFANSQIDGAGLLTGVEEWASRRGTLAQILAQVEGSQEVAALRERAAADLVAVITDRGTSTDPRNCGLAFLMRALTAGPQMAGRAFSVTTADCDANNHPIFVHEIGHNLGANHLPDDAPSPVEAVFPYAYAYSNGEGFTSVMAPGGFRKLVFSNPRVLVDGVAAGIEDERDNARALQQTVPIAAAFRAGGQAVPRENVPPPVPPPPIEVPASPTDLVGTVVSATEVRLRWKDNGSGEIGFRIEASAAGGGFATVDEVPRDTVQHLVDGLEPATAYRFRVLAVGAQADSAFSNEVRLVTRDAPPAAPAALTAEPAGAGAVVLAWQPVARATGYEVEVRTADPAGDRGAVPVVLAAGGASVDGLAPATPYSFRVRATSALGASEWSAEASATTAGAGAPCAADGAALCLLGGRFEVRARWRNPHPPFGHGVAAAEAAPGTDVTGFFTFFDPENVELVVKMLDARTLNDAFWHFYGALSDVEYWISAVDTATGASRTYHNQPFSLCGRGDTGAFPGHPDLPAATRAPRPAAASRAAAPAGACVPGPEALCLAGGRFRVEVDWVNPHAPDSAGVGRVFPGAASDVTGHFWFFSPDNLELSVKILDARAINGHFWILWGALSDVGYTLRVTDTESGEAHHLTNPPLTLCGRAVTDLL